MSEEIRPALSAEEWQRGMSHEGRAGLRWSGSAVQHYWGNTGAWVEIDPSDAHAIAAMGNAALPDDDPRKITRADVHACADASMFDGPHPALARLALKLAALLPLPPLPPQDPADAADRLGRRTGV